MRQGDIVRVTRISDPEFWDEERDGDSPLRFEGRLGILRGPTDGMLEVAFVRGEREAFWPEELEVVKAREVRS